MNNPDGVSVYVFGTMSSTTLNSLTASAINNVTGVTNVLGVSSVNEVNVNYTKD